uniref:Cystatin isoform 2 S1 n=1 Tax=Cupiennius salei TaxID=6928 RepID=A0A4Y5UGL9_CUPSA|nr:cystatin isoform 2 S1 [Cupiennius salei]QDC23071.1 cystatin isoform 2 S2 [Cupiennius salei]
MVMQLLVYVFTACLFQASVGQMVGGWTPVEDTNSSDFQKITDFAAEKITSELRSNYKMRLMEILSAKKQLVAGMKYRFEMRLGATECKVKDNEDGSLCDFLHCGAVHTCNATVWTRPWLSDTRLTNFSCEKEKGSC